MQHVRNYVQAAEACEGATVSIRHKCVVVTTTFSWCYDTEEEGNEPSYGEVIRQNKENYDLHDLSFDVIGLYDISDDEMKDVQYDTPGKGANA
jgi:hypothetical protein